MSIDFTDDMLREAVVRADKYEMEALPADSKIEHEFSKEFERKMKRLIRFSKIRNPIKKMVIFHKRVVALIATIIILFSSVMGISAVRAAVFGFISDVHEKFTHVFFGEGQSSQNAADKFVNYEPSYIPEGFKLVNKNTGGPVLTEYEKGNDFISYSQQRLEDVSLNINTEGVKPDELEFKGLSAKYYSNQGVQNLLWRDDEYLYMVSSTLDKDTLIKIAQSVEAVSGK